MLTLYANRGEISSKASYIPLLFPFWGVISKKQTPYVNQVFDSINFDKNYYHIIDNPKKADCTLLPHNYWVLKKYDPGYLAKFVQKVEEFKKPLLIDATGDCTDEVPIRNGVVLRNSVYKGALKNNEVIIPAYVEDLLTNYCAGKFSPKLLSAAPVVGFTGWAKTDFIRSLIPRFYLTEKTQGLIFRNLAMKYLTNTVGIKTNFILRKSYSGHIKTISGDVKQYRTEFVNNIVDSDYTLCIKGDGNFSSRFYETLSLGRIPLVVHTDNVFPLEKEINYREFCLFVSYKNIDKIGKLLLDFHGALSSEDFFNKQNRAREVFNKYLRIDSFTKYLVKEVKSRI